MLRAYKYRIYPTKQQEQLFAKTFGCCRKVWNDCVAVFKEDYDIWMLENLYGAFVPDNYRKLKYRTAKEMKIEYPWLNDVSNCSLQWKIKHFNDYKKQKYSQSIGQPKFKKKNSKESFTVSYGSPQHRFAIKDNKIRLEKIGWVKFVESRKIPEKAVLKSITVSKNSAGQYFASICCDTHIEQLPKTGKLIGIDVGLKSYLTTSDNTHIANPRYLSESQAKIARKQMWQAKKKGAKKGEEKSSRWLKLQHSINKDYEHLANQRKDFLHKLSTDLIRNYDVICLEDLNVKGMMQNHKLSKSIGDASWSMFNVFLTYKAEWYGKEIKRVDRFYASSKTCSNCGHKIDDLTLNDRVFACPECGLEIDRDYNAAINIKNTVDQYAVQRTPMDEVTNPNEAFMFNN